MSTTTPLPICRKVAPFDGRILKVGRLRQASETEVTHSIRGVAAGAHREKGFCRPPRVAMVAAGVCSTHDFELCDHP